MKKILIDTNILVPLEDSRIVPESYSTLIRSLSERNSSIFVHKASYDDIFRDADENRKRQSFSKIQKYQQLEKSDRTRDDLARLFGEISNLNDVADCHMLAAVFDNAVDALVTEDNDLHRRARRSGLEDRVFRVNQMLDAIAEASGKLIGTLSFVESRFCYQLSLDDPIFRSLEEDYSSFRDWWSKCCITHRQCWVVRDSSRLAGLVVFNDETSNEGDGRFPGKKVLKLCTFKVSEQHRGGRLGEQLLKQSLWYAFTQRFDVVYTTVFKKQMSLIDLLSYFGFQLHSINNGELVYARDFSVDTLVADEFDWHRLNYPKLVVYPRKSAIVPIRAAFHKRLLPEASKYRASTTIDMFESSWSLDSKTATIPATSIRKVYVCKSNVASLERGTRLYFYVSKNDQIQSSQSLSCVCVLEELSSVNSFDDLLSLTAKRSVYREDELRRIFNSGGKTKVLKFIMIGALRSQMHLNTLVAHDVLKAAPQSIVQIVNRSAEFLARNCDMAYLS